MNHYHIFKRCMIASIILFLVIQTNSANRLDLAEQEDNKPCFEFYRKDIMVKWTIPKGSILCTTPPNSTSSSAFYFEVAGNQLYIIADNMNNTVDYNWRSIINGIGGKFAIAVYKPKVAGGLVMKIQPTQDQKKIGQYEYTWNDGLGAHKLTTFYVAEKDIKASTDFNLVEVVGLFFLVITLAILLVMYNMHSLSPCIVTLTVYFLGVSVALSYTQITGPIHLSLILIACLLVSVAIGYGVSFVQNEYSGWVAFGLLNAFIAYSWGVGMFLLFSVCNCLLLLVSMGFMCCKSPRKNSELIPIFISVGILMGTIQMVLTTAYVYNIPGVFLSLLHRDLSDYVVGTNVDGLSVLICAVFTGVLFIPTVIYCNQILKRVDQEAALDISLVR